MVDNVEKNSLGPDTIFGENALLENETQAKRSASVVAIDEVECIGLSRHALQDAFGNSLKQLVLKNKERIVLNKSKIMNEFLDWQKEKIHNKCSMVSYKNGEVVFEKNIEYKGLYMLLDGQISGGFMVDKIFGEEKLENCESFKFEEDITALTNCS